MTVVDCTTAPRRRRAAADTDAVLEAAALDRFKLYGPLLNAAHSTLYPAPFCQYGATTRLVHALIGVFAARHAEESGGSLSRAQCVSRWRQGLSVSLQRAISCSVLNAWGDMVPLVDGDAPDVHAYKRVRLLRANPTAPPPVAPGAAGVD